MKKDVDIKFLMLFIVFTAILVFNSMNASALNDTITTNLNSSVDPVVDSYSDALVLFYSDTRPHCHEEIAFLPNEVEINYPDWE